jgi:Fe-Mn family superoxide dismutase
MGSNRRDFLKKTSLLGLSAIAGNLLAKSDLALPLEEQHHSLLPETAFLLPPLPYAYDALEPFIDKLTMEIHHDKHHKAYVDKLNSVDVKSFDLALSDEKKCGMVKADTPAIIRNNLGGHVNHSLFWTLLKPNANQAANMPEGTLAQAINNTFKSFDEFKKEFSDKALKIFGSGWCWLIVDEQKTLRICTTANQDNPMMSVAADKGHPVLALDVWEHAYYLKYQNKRVDYIANWWNIINWQKAEALYSGK